MNELPIGTAVTTRQGVQVRRYAVDFPGWDAPNVAEFLLDIPMGLVGKVTYVEHHGHNPWTRYSIHFADGTRAYGLVWGEDFDVLNGGVSR